MWVSGLPGPDGAYEIQSGLSGRFVLLTSRGSSVQVGSAFYGGSHDLLTRDIFLSPDAIYPAPPASLPARPYVVPQQQLLFEATVLPALRPAPSTFLLQQGPLGSPAFLYVEGASPSATEVRIADVSAQDLGGRFNFATLGSSGLAADAAAPALVLTPAPALPNAELATAAFSPPTGESLHPVLHYTGDAGNLATVRNEAVATLANRRADLLASFARFDTANGTGAEAVPFHLATAAANVGYHISGATSLRATLRQDVSATALAPFFGITRSGREAAQNVYAAATFSTSTVRQWSNTLRYGLARKRQQAFLFAPFAPQTITVNGVTANVTLPSAPPHEDLVTNRDEATYTTSYPVRAWLYPSLDLRYQNERAVDQATAYRESLTRTHLTAVPALAGELRHRVFYSAAATLDRSPTYGFNAAPSLGLTYAAVQPSPKRFHGTVLRATAATGFREPSLLEALNPGTPRSRAFTLAEDQQILPSLQLTTTYFHNQFSHDYELRTQSSATQQAVLSPTLAYRTQGLALDLRYHPYPRIRLAAGYTYLAALTEQSASRDGLVSALPGARPFHRPPQTGYATAGYNGPRLSLSFKASFSSRSDDSTTLSALPLPNRNLSPAWASLDAGASLVLTQRITAFTQLTNLADSRSIAPIGYRSAPFLLRTGLRIRLGRE